MGRGIKLNKNYLRRLITNQKYMYSVCAQKIKHCFTLNINL